MKIKFKLAIGNEIVTRYLKPNMSKVDTFKRYQSYLKIEDLFPSNKKWCVCGCRRKLGVNDVRYKTIECLDRVVKAFYVIKGDVKFIKHELIKSNGEICVMCESPNEYLEVDHINPVYKGGGACYLDNFQLLDDECHKVKTRQDLKR